MKKKRKTQVRFVLSVDGFAFSPPPSLRVSGGGIVLRPRPRVALERGGLVGEEVERVGVRVEQHGVDVPPDEPPQQRADAVCEK